MRVIGIWDLESDPFTIGQLITFIYELNLKAYSNLKARIELCVIKNSGIYIDRLLNILSIALLFDSIRKIHLYRDLHECHNDFKGLKQSIEFFPPRLKDGSSEYDFDTTLRISEYHRKFGSVFQPKIHHSYADWAKSYFKKVCNKKLPIVMHLKNNPNTPNLSNADFDQWFEFLNYCQDNYGKYKFILIGNEKCDERIRNLKNVHLSSSDNISLGDEMCLIYYSKAFMGMSSGPCNMAIYGGKPYVIFKNPEHHKRKMLKELQGKKSFPFAQERQYFIQEKENKTILLEMFEKLGV